MSWLHSIRTPYWTESNRGKRYGLLREAKNRVSEFKGQYTLASVSSRTTILTSSLKNIESGEFQLQDKILDVLLKDLGITMAEFTTMTKPVAPDKQKDKPVTKPATAARPAPTPPATKPAVPSSPKPEPAQAAPKGKLTVVNHNLEGFFLKMIGNELHLFPNAPQHSKETFLGAADEAGGKLRPRSVTI